MSISEKGKLPVRKFLQAFQNGDRVLLKAYPGYQNGIYPLRFHGKIGEITRKQGDCYIVNVKDGGKLKECIIHPVHLNRA